MQKTFLSIVRPQFLIRYRKMPKETSDDIPRAVEFLLLSLIRWLSFGCAALFGLLSIIAWMRHWPRWISVPFMVVSVLAFLFGRINRPKGKWRFDSRGPKIEVPRRSNFHDQDH